jgi:hypothetical protein
MTHTHVINSLAGIIKQTPDSIAKLSRRALGFGLSSRAWSHSCE